MTRALWTVWCSGDCGAYSVYPMESAPKTWTCQACDDARRDAWIERVSDRPSPYGDPFFADLRRQA